MNYKHTTKDELVIELQKLQQENNLLKKSHLRATGEHKRKGNDHQISKDQFQQLFCEMMQGAAFHEMIYDDKGKAVDYRTLDINKAYESIMGISREQIIGKSASSFLPDSELRKWLDIFSPVAEGEGRRNYKQYSQLNDKYFEGVVFSPKPGYFWVTFSDFTKRRFAERTLQKSEEKWRKLVATIPGFVALHDLEGRFLFLNHYADGFSEKDIIGKSLYDLISETSKDEYQRNFRNCIRTKQTQHLEYYGFGNNKAIRIYESYLVPILEKNQVVNVMDIATDITKQKKMEEKLLKSKELLERLNQHQNEIREKERAVISREIHDELGQSMTALKLDLGQMHQYVSKNIEACKKLEKMIELTSDTIKNVQRISSELRPGILDDLGLVSAVEWYCDEFEKRTGINCEFKFDDPVYEDTRINLVFFRVMQETLTNVIRHARATSVSINLYKTIKGNIMTIQDNGVGIQEEKIESHKSLGLISMRERVRQFGGKIIISSGKGSGTRLSVFIPEKKKAVQ
jgi:two-component system, NarL family, sensor histidine kinase UhpB